MCARTQFGGKARAGRLAAPLSARVMRALSAEPEPLGPAGTRLEESSFGDLVLARLGAAVLRAKNLALL